MFDAGLPFEAGVQPRAQGAGLVSARLRAGRSVLGALHQRGSARVLLPRPAGTALEAVLLNTAGGITGGDRFGWNAEAEAGADLVVTTQAAERLYRAQASEMAEVEVALRLGPGSRLHWLPQETIVFDRAALTRRLVVEMAEDAELVVVESTVLGRAAMGERVDTLRFRDSWRVRCCGRLVHAEGLRFWGRVGGEGAATLGGALALATLLCVAQGAEDRLGPLRRHLAAELAVRAAASAASAGCVVVRLLAPDHYALRPALARLVTLVTGRALPRVWAI